MCMKTNKTFKEFHDKHFIISSAKYPFIGTSRVPSTNSGQEID